MTATDGPASLAFRWRRSRIGLGFPVTGVLRGAPAPEDTQCHADTGKHDNGKCN